MKIVVLTTETPHHTYFAQEIQKEFPLTLILLEQKHCTAPFPTAHPFETKRDAYEQSVFFHGKNALLRDIAPTIEVGTVNDMETFAYLERVAPDVVVSFGIGKIAHTLIDRFSSTLINLHGGNPEAYRGLDSHLWSIYHKDFDNLITTLHRVSSGLDEGEIIGQAHVPLHRGMQLHQLRRYNTDQCIALTLDALHAYVQHGKFSSRPQETRGRYYSFMPAVLKELCCAYFEKYTRTL